MAKAKKSESATSPSGSKSKSPAKKQPSKASSGGGGAAPMINTDVAAQSAARMLLNRAANAPINTATGQKKESSTFKQMKDSLAKPHLASMDSMLNSTNTSGGQSHLPHQSNQKGHSQTYNADVTRTGVPRRTPG